MIIKGVLPPLVTPLKDDKVAINQFHKNLEEMRRHEVGGVVVLGSTGEAPLLHEIEKVQLIKAARIMTPDDEVLVVGTGMETVNATVRMSKIASEYGADALLVITPHYYKGAMTAEALETYYVAVADRTKTPVIIYNIPQVTGFSISPSTVAQLAKHEKIVGIKDSSGDIGYMLELCAALPEDFNILCGSAKVFVPSLMCGASGGILALANCLPEPVAAMYRAWEKEDFDTAMSLQKRLLPAIKLVMSTYGLAGVKACMNLRGLFGGDPRIPVLSLDAKDQTELETMLEMLREDKLISDISLK